MNVRSLLRKWLQPTPPVTRKVRPLLELLEDRLAPASYRGFNQFNMPVLVETTDGTTGNPSPHQVIAWGIGNDFQGAGLKSTFNDVSNAPRVLGDRTALNERPFYAINAGGAWGQGVAHDFFSSRG